MNQIIAVSKSHYGAYAKQKKIYTEVVHYSVMNVKPIVCKVDIFFVWYRKNRRSDPDNISAGGTKYCLDGLVNAGVLENDGWKQIGRISHSFEVDKKNPRVEMRLIPHE